MYALVAVSLVAIPLAVLSHLAGGPVAAARLRRPASRAGRRGCCS